MKTRYLIGGLVILGGGIALLWPKGASAATPTPTPTPTPPDDGGGEPFPEKQCPPGYTPTGPGGGCVDEQGRPPSGWATPGTMGEPAPKPPTKQGVITPPAPPPKQGTVQAPEKFVPAEHERDYPTPGYFYQVRAGDTFGGTTSDHSIAYRALLSAGYMAAQKYGGAGMPATFPESFAKIVAKDSANRSRYIAQIQCVAFNDAGYGTWGYGSEAKPGPHGRAIRLRPDHANNRARLLAGKNIIRNIRIGSWKTPGDGKGIAIDAELKDGYEFLLLPRIDLKHLYETRHVEIDGWHPAFDWKVDTYEVMPDTFGCDGGVTTFS